MTSVEVNHKPMESARKGQEVCIKIENPPGETPKLFGRHFDHTDLLMSRVSITFFFKHERIEIHSRKPGIEKGKIEDEWMGKIGQAIGPH